MDTDRMKSFFVANILAYEEEFYLHILKKVYEPEVVRDILQHAYLKAWKGLPRLKDMNKVKSWMYSIINNCIYEYWRKVLSERENKTDNTIDTEDGIINILDTVIGDEDVFDELVKKLESKLAIKALDMLKEEDRILIHMRYVDEMTVKDMANITRIKEKTLSSKLIRAAKRYRKAYFTLEARSPKQPKACEKFKKY